MVALDNCSVFDKYDYIGIVFGQGFNDQQTPLAAAMSNIPRDNFQGGVALRGP